MADQVDEVKAKTDIVSVISEYIELKKAGRNYKALCPFHSEKTPSFMVSPELQIFKCFGCGEAGDVIAFLQKYEGMDFYEALKFLAERAGVKLKPLKGQRAGKKEKIYKINSLAGHFYNYVLLKHEAGKKPLNYLTKERGLKTTTIKEFKLGYSPDEPFAIKKFLVEKKGIKEDELKDAGITYQKSGRSFDRFRGRIIFPLYDHRKNPIGFAGRLMPGAKKDLAKYINTPETDVYHKSRALYGLSHTRRNIKKKGEAVVVEGELDMLSSWQAGIKHTVALKGTALTQEQVKLLSRYADKLVMALDADVAGDTAARRGIEIAEKEGFEIRVARLKGFKDPDEMVRKSPKKFKKALKNAAGVWDFIIDSIFSKHKGKGGDAKARISKEVVPVLSSINDKIVQAHYTEKVAKKLDVPTEAVASQVGSTAREDKKKEEPEVVIAHEEKKSRKQLLEERLLAIGFRHKPSVLTREEVYTLISTPLAKRILDEFDKYYKENNDFDPSEFAGELPNQLVEGFTDMVLKDLEGIESERPEVYKKEFNLVKRELEVLDVKDKLEEVGKKIKELEPGKDEEELEEAKKRFGKLTQTLSELEGEEYKGIIL